MQLYFVSATDIDDAAMSLDLFVTAASADDALEVWRNWLATDLEGYDSENWRVFLVPQAADHQCVHPWHAPAPLGVTKIIP